MAGVFDGLLAELSHVAPVRPIGRVVEVGAGTVRVSGLTGEAQLGDNVSFSAELGGEIIALTPQSATVLADGPVQGLAIGQRVALRDEPEIFPDASWIGRIVDPFGRPLDGRPMFRGATAQPLQGARAPRGTASPDGRAT